MIRWYAGLPLTLVAAQSLMAGLVLSAVEAEGLVSWGHEALLLAALPILG